LQVGATFREFLQMAEAASGGSGSEGVVEKEQLYLAQVRSTIPFYLLPGHTDEMAPELACYAFQEPKRAFLPAVHVANRTAEWLLLHVQVVLIALHFTLTPHLT
jgi:hypothetical protein